jgi:hypothetical protein
MKVRRISRFQQSFSFKYQEENIEIFYNRFLKSDLGKIYLSIPWDELVKVFKLQSKNKGPQSLFSSKGKIALMFLKHYAACSDRKLIEQLNGNIEYQFFCDIYLGTQRLTNFKIISEIRCQLSKTLDINNVQQVLFNKWHPYIEEQSSITMDATCYESELRYPTDQKLLWECVDWLYKQLKLISKAQKVRLIRTKYNKWKMRYVSYSKMRRKTKKKRIILTRSLLKLVKKLFKALDDLSKHNEFKMPKSYYFRIITIKTIHEQQYSLFTTGISPKNRIVSIHKNYIRPIVRGKEIKKVEFGAKVNKLQIGGISFIQRLSFDNFNEGTQYKKTIYLAQHLTKIKVKIVGADAIYATNKNRTYTTANQIKTDFKPKGRKSKHYKERKQISKMITKERASRLEGSFGKEKEHYHLKKVKARTKKTEILWIFFGIHTANCLLIGKRIYKHFVNQNQVA